MLVEKATSYVLAAMYMCGTFFRQFSIVQKPLSSTVCHTKNYKLKCPLRTVRYRAVTSEYKLDDVRIGAYNILTKWNCYRVAMRALSYVHKQSRYTWHGIVDMYHVEQHVTKYRYISR